MRKRFLITVILFFAISVTLCGCAVFGAPLGEAEVPNHSGSNTVRIYICGAVEHEGYYEAKVGTDYVELLLRAGMLSQSVPPTVSSSYVDGSVTLIIVDYYDGGTRHVSINANSILIATRSPVDGLSADVVDRLADYIDEHGKIANKKQILQALGDDYYDNYYKLFVAQEDYENEEVD